MLDLLDRAVAGWWGGSAIGAAVHRGSTWLGEAVACSRVGRWLGGSEPPGLTILAWWHRSLASGLWTLSRALVTFAGPGTARPSSAPPATVTSFIDSIEVGCPEPMVPIVGWAILGVLVGEVFARLVGGRPLAVWGWWLRGWWLLVAMGLIGWRGSWGESWRRSLFSRLVGGKGMVESCAGSAAK